MTDDSHPPQWNAGWVSCARRLDSPNFGTRPAEAQVDLIVVHSISLPPGEFGGPAVLELFTNQLDFNAHPYFKTIAGLHVSSHFFIRRDGEIWQLVSCDARAWHAGVSHYRGRANCNDDSIGIELEGLEGGLFEPAQYQALTQLVAAIAHHYPICHIAGHEHIAPGRKADPGAGFDWQLLHSNLRWPSDCFPRGTAACRNDTA